MTLRRNQVRTQCFGGRRGRRLPLRYPQPIDLNHQLFEIGGLCGENVELASGNPGEWDEMQIPKSTPAISLLMTVVCMILASCAGPMADTGGKYMHEQRLAAIRKEKISEMPADLNSPATPAYLFHLKAVKDYEYGNYVRALRRATSWGEFAADSVKIILDSLVAVTGGEATKSALGAASAGVTGATTSIKKNVLFDQSITTFITKMDALRLNKWNEILCKLGRCKDTPALSSFTVAEAFADLEEYGRCGTLDAALRDVDAKVSADKKTAEVKNDNINKGKDPNHSLP